MSLSEPDIREEVRQQVLKIDPALSYYFMTTSATKLLIYQASRTGYLLASETQVLQIEPGLL
jgi:hypothetical protein